MRAFLGLDQLQSGADGISGGVGSAAQQAVSLAHLYQHGAEVVALEQVGLALLGGHLALAQLNHLCNHFIHLGIGLGINDLYALDIKAALLGSGLNLGHVANQDNLHNALCLDAGSGFQDTSVGALGEDDGLGVLLQLFNQSIKHS